MSVIGYLRQCEGCGVRMIVTVEAKDTDRCPDCFQTWIKEYFEAAKPSELLGDDDDGPDFIPPGQVRG